MYIIVIVLINDLIKTALKLKINLLSFFYIYFFFWIIKKKNKRLMGNKN